LKKQLNAAVMPGTRPGMTIIPGRRGGAIATTSEAQCGQGVECPFDPVGIAHEKQIRLTRLTHGAILALY
jgi:hypothetical protein